MHHYYEARRISRPKAIMVRRDPHKHCIVLSAYGGFIVIEPHGSHCGDGKLLSREEADYELQPVWCTEAKTKLDEARKLLGLATV